MPKIKIIAIFRLSLNRYATVEHIAAKELLRNCLAGKQFRPTKEREAILDEIMHVNGHFDAEEFFTRLKVKGLKISRATVYNTLDLFVTCGLISKYRFDENHSKYERAIGRPRHDHLICLECGDIIEFVSDRLTKVQEEATREHHFKMKNASLQIFGICQKCQAGKPR